MTIAEAGKLARRAYNAFPSGSHKLREPPASYRVVAFIPVYNEADIIESTIRHLGESGVQVYVLDNWSNDGTWELVRKNASGNLIGAERFLGGPSKASYDLQSSLARIATLEPADAHRIAALLHVAARVFPGAMSYPTMTGLTASAAYPVRVFAAPMALVHSILPSQNTTKISGYLRLYAELCSSAADVRRLPEAAVDYCDRRPIRLKQVRSEILEWAQVLA